MRITPGVNVFFRIIKIQSICQLTASFVLTIFSIQMNGRSKLTCREIGQGHPSVMIYINFVDLRSLMLHAKFQNYRPSGSEEEDFLKQICYL